MLCAHSLAVSPVEETVIRPLALPAAAEIHVHGSHRFVATLCGPGAAERAELERFIQDVFRRAHGATIRHFMPQLMSLRDHGGKLLAVCGLRNAGDAELFLETYLDAPVETLIAQRAGQEVARTDIVEIGNLAVAEPGIAPHLLASVSHYLHGTDTQWAVFTAIPMLRNSLTRLNMQLEVLADASLERIVPHERPEWGRYYDQNPQVMAVRRASRPDFTAG
jgi:hypothetical protein